MQECFVLDHFTNEWFFCTLLTFGHSTYQIDTAVTRVPSEDEMKYEMSCLYVMCVYPGTHVELLYIHECTTPVCSTLHTP